MQESVRIFKHSAKKGLNIFLGALCFVVFGLLLRDKAPVISWLSIIFFGMCACGGLYLMLPDGGYLKLDAEGFEVKTLARHYKVFWHEVDGFALDNMKRQPMIRIRFSAQYNEHLNGRKISMLMTGKEGLLPNNYTAGSSEIVAALNEWKARCHT